MLRCKLCKLKYGKKIWAIFSDLFLYVLKNETKIRIYDLFQSVVQMVRIQGWGSCGREFESHRSEKGERFESDFVLFLKNKDKQDNITYQVFIEPKWDQLLLLDKRKNDFLQDITYKAEILDINFWNYKLIWLPFYNKSLEIEFEKAMDDKL